MPIRRSRSNIHFEIIFLFEIVQNTVPENSLRTGGSGCFCGQHCINDFHVFILDCGLTFLGDLGYIFSQPCSRNILLILKDLFLSLFRK